MSDDVMGDIKQRESRPLSDDEKLLMQGLELMGERFIEAVGALGQSRETSLAKTKIEEAVMWAVRHITK